MTDLMDADAAVTWIPAWMWSRVMQLGPAIELNCSIAILKTMLPQRGPAPSWFDDWVESFPRIFGFFEEVFPCQCYLPVLCGLSNSLSNSPCPLGSARGCCPFILLRSKSLKFFCQRRLRTIEFSLSNVLPLFSNPPAPPQLFSKPPVKFFQTLNPKP